MSLKNDENKYIVTADNEFYLQVSSTNITKQIKPDNIYQIGTYSYKVLTIFNDISIPGLLIFKLSYSEQSQETHTYAVDILNGSSIQIAKSQSLTINTKVTDNGNIISPSPALLYSSSNEVIATINNSGVVSILTVGTVVFTVSLASDTNIKDSISVEVTEDATHNITYSLSSTNSPDSEIKQNQTKSYVATKYDNGSTITQTFTFSVVGDASSYEMVVIDGNSCSIKALKANYNIVLRTVDNSDSSKVVEKNISLKALF